MEQSNCSTSRFPRRNGGENPSAEPIQSRSKSEFFSSFLNQDYNVIEEMVDNAVDTGPVYFWGDELEMGFRIDRLGDIGLNS